MSVRFSTSSTPLAEPTLSRTPRDSASSTSDKLAAFNAPFEMRFRGLLRGSDPRELDRFIDDAWRSGLPSIQQFARTPTRDIEAVTDAVAEPWSSGQADGEINRRVGRRDRP